MVKDSENAPNACIATEGGWMGGSQGKWDLAEGVSSRGGEATPVQLLEKADERRGEGVIAQFALVHPLVLGAPHGVGLEFGGVDGNVKYLVGEPVLKAESCRHKAPPPG